MSLELPANFEQFVKDSNRGQIKLSDFSALFFPMFVAYFNGQPVELSRWLEFTRTKGYEWVDVTKADEVVFSVPPVMQATSFAPGSGLRQDPADIMAMATLKDKTMPGAGNKHIRANLTEALDLEDDYVDGRSQYHADWIPIFNYYGYSLDSDTDTKAKAGSAKKSDYNPDDFEDFDEL